MTRGLVILAAATAVASLALACSPPDKGTLRRETSGAVTERASLQGFRTGGVSAVFEKRCGSLDCHGSISRNLRIYSSYGLRLPNDAGLVPGTGDTTLEESTASYESILTLEPEETNDVVVRGADPATLLVVKKPLELEKHKGGPVMRRGDDTEHCITSWLKQSALEPLDNAACARAAVFPKE